MLMLCLGFPHALLRVCPHPHANVVPRVFPHANAVDFQFFVLSFQVCCITPQVLQIPPLLEFSNLVLFFSFFLNTT